ncbi:MAG TPA: S53 family serine peptidase [Solirubrobacteraceae bacterium]|nr:S53 family serine peptidase [Solirubrobacteraceae bacterium]
MGTSSWGLSRTLGRARIVIATAACLLCAGALCATSALAATPSTHWTWLGAAPANGSVSLALPLKADLHGLQQFATAVSDPKSPQYGQYDTVANLAKRFGAPAAERARVASYLTAHGATGVKIDVTGLFADATMNTAQAGRLFGTSLGNFRTAGSGAHGATFMAPVSTVSVPAALRDDVAGVVGLNTEPVFGSSAPTVSRDGAFPRKAAVSEHAAASGNESTDDESGYLQRTGTAAGCAPAVSQSGFTPNQYLTAYNYAPLQASGFEGQGERVALIEIDGFRYSDLRSFSKCFDLATPAINGFGVGLKHPLAPGGESTLDLEVLDAAAPKLKAVDVYESRPSAVDVLQSLTAPLTNAGSKPDIISASLGSCEEATRLSIGNSKLRYYEGALALASASGISVLASSGDDGSSACLTPDGEPLPGLAVSYPASSPFVTGVGGTNFALDPTNHITAEEVWNDTPLVNAAAGGGFSNLFKRPSYQNGFDLTSRRGVPDVSMLADVAPGYEIFCTAKGDCIGKGNTSPWTQVGGTSAAAPLLAGGLALVDQALRQNHRQDIGLANPLLYGVAHSSSAASVISDIVANNNDMGLSLVGKAFGCCTAGPGYDEASGLGSINLAGLALVAGSVVPSIVNVGVSVPGQRHPVAAQHLLATVSCSGHCLMGAYARIKIGSSRKVITKYSGISLLKNGGHKTVKIGLDKKTLSKLRGALSHHQKVAATIFGAILDPSGNIESHTQGKDLRVRG